MTSREDENNAAFSLSPQNNEGSENGSASEEARRSESMPPSGVEAASLRALKEGLAEVPHGEKSALVHVQRVAPELADDDHLLAFLRGEDFDVRLALKRLLRYWTHRYEIFGPEKYALPMTLSGAMSGQLRSLRDGYLTLLPVCDEVGRSIIYAKHVQPVPQVEEKLRMLWYLLHIIMQDPAAQRNGYVFLTDSRGPVNGLDPKWMSRAVPVCSAYFPIQCKYAHICHTSAGFTLTGQIVAMVSRKQLRSVFMHSGTEEQVLENLSKFGLPKHCIPEGLGGTLHVSTDAFVQDRLATEGRSLELNDNIARIRSPSSEDYASQSNPDTKGEATENDTCNFDHAAKPKLEAKAAFEASLDVIRQEYYRDEVSHAGNFAAESPFTPKPLHRNEEGIPETERRKGFPAPATSLGHHQPEDNIVKAAVAENSFMSLVQGGTLAGGDNSIEVEHDTVKSNSLGIIAPSEKQPLDQSTLKSSQPNQRKDNHSDTQRKRSLAMGNAARGGNPTHGRNGDPRMNRAVQAKLDNPDLTLVGALVAGGFVFPNLSAPGVSIGATLDEDGISVYQRRNQLMRRLRYINKKSRAK